MKGSRDLWILIILFIVLGTSITYIVYRSSASGSPSSYSTGKRGTKALYMELRRLHFKVGRFDRSIDKLPADVHTLILPSSSLLNPEYDDKLAKWVKRGNTLIVATTILDRFGIDNTFDITTLPNPYADIVSLHPVPNRYAAGVKKVRIQPDCYIRSDKDLFPIVENSYKTVVGTYRFGKGRMIVTGDSWIMANGGIGLEDNVVLVTNLVYESAGYGGKVLFIELDKKAIAKFNEKKSPWTIIGLGGKLAFSNFLLVVVMVLISAGRRFGAVHPLPEAEEKPRGWEFVHAMAGLYRRAKANNAALTSIYQSFRRDLVFTFGISPAAYPTEIADTVFRLREVDKAKLAALLERGDMVAYRQDISDAEAVELTRAIENCRRELGIARSTDN